MFSTLIYLVQTYKPDATVEDVKRELPYCQHKLDLIIKREGDGEGRRMEPRYLAQLIAEQIRANQNEKRFFSVNKERAHRSVLPQNRNLIVTEHKA